MARSTEEILAWIAEERDYQALIGFGNAKSLEEELEFAKPMLQEALDSLPCAGKPRLALANIRRIAANFTRALEKHGIPDQEMQKVRAITIVIERDIRS
jgi:hypothetical protein